MIRHFSISAVDLVLALSGTTSPQQNLVLHNDRNDTCRLFKALGE